VSTAAVPATSVDLLTIHQLIASGQTIVDVSPGGSEWLNAVFALHADIRALFYARQDSEIAAFFSSRADPSQAVHQGSANTDGCDLDGDTLREGIRHIHYLHIGSARPVRRVLKGAARLLSHSRIDFIQFPLDTFDIWTAQTASQILAASDYEIFEILHAGGEGAVTLQHYPLSDPERQHKMVQIVAIHQRVVPLLAVDADADVPYRNGFQLAQKCGVQFRGLIQVGAYDGSYEHQHLKRLGLRQALFIEASPVPFARLKKTCKDLPNASFVNCAILDKNGPVEFTITNHDQSSSLLKPARALEELSIKPDHVITVAGKTLDYVLKEQNLTPQSFNVLVIDVQGAELLVLRGAASLLPHLDVVNTEVNFEELYHGGAQIDEIDDFLAPYGFRRVYTTACLPGMATCSTHRAWGSTRRAWGDAVYLKEQFAGKARVEIPACLSLLFGGDATSARPAIQPPA
jgi:FkbM family methyltransferase